MTGRRGAVVDDPAGAVAGYRSLELPLRELPAPLFEMVAEWDLARFLTLLRSRSATAQFIRAKGYDPVAGVEDG